MAEINPRNYQILLLAAFQDICDLINFSLQETIFFRESYKLIWSNNYEEWQKIRVDGEYDLYLIEAQFFDLIAIAGAKYLSSLPTIVITSDDETGFKALQNGATDYWQFSTIDSLTIERSLRLIFRNNQKLRLQECPKKSSFYQDFFQNSVEGLFSLDILADGSLVYGAVNSAYSQIIGLKSEQIIGAKITTIISSIEVRKYLDCLELEKPISYEHSLQIGEQFCTLAISIVPVKDCFGKICRIQGSVRDITQEKQVITQQIRHTRYRNLLRSIALKIRQSLDIESIINTTVEELQKILGTDRVVIVQFTTEDSGVVIEESVKANFSSMLGKAIGNQYYHKISLLDNNGKDSFYAWNDIENEEIALDYQALLKQYQIRANLVIPILRRSVFQARENSAINSVTHLWGLLCVHQCQTTRQWQAEEIELLQQLGEQLNIALSQAELLASEVKQRQELVRSNEELEQFAYVASHDLQAPLQTISNYAQLLEHRYRDRLDEKADKYINYIVSSVNRMRTQIDDLLEYSRVGRQQNTFRETDFNLVIAQAIANLDAEIESNQAQIYYPEQLPRLIVDCSQFIIVFQNLISNSLKYRSDREPLIQIRVEQKVNYWQFSVEDNGIGIGSKHYQRIFQIFQRLHTQEEYPGTGIGLAICQKIVQRHGGKIWVESAENQKTTFYFTIPESRQLGY